VASSWRRGSSKGGQEIDGASGSTGRSTAVKQNQSENFFFFFGSESSQARVARAGRQKTLCSDTMLGISNLHYRGGKGHIYSTCT
jgi:hypothetical protein